MQPSNDSWRHIDRQEVHELAVRAMRDQMEQLQDAMVHTGPKSFANIMVTALRLRDEHKTGRDEHAEVMAIIMQAALVGLGAAICDGMEKTDPCD